METIILILIGAIAGGAIVNMMYVCKEGKSGSKGITDEYITESGIKRTAKKDREEYIVYKKLNSRLEKSAKQDEESIHYSDGIPSKNTEDYELVKTFPTFAKMNSWLNKKYNNNSWRKWSFFS